MIIACSALAIVFTSCKKDEESKPVTPTKENITGIWMVTSAKISSGSNSVNVFNNPDEVINFFAPCERDDKYHFNSDMSFHIEDAGTQCDPPTNINGDWAFTNATSMTIDGEDGTIDSFDGKTLVFSVDQGSSKMTTTYTKQ
jgi:hypothetical protein